MGVQWLSQNFDWRGCCAALARLIFFMRDDELAGAGVISRPGRKAPRAAGDFCWRYVIDYRLDFRSAFIIDGARAQDAESIWREGEFSIIYARGLP